MMVTMLLCLLLQQDGTRALRIKKEGGDYKAFLIGINAYADTRIPSLRTPENDVRAMADVLRGRYGFEIQMLTGSEATEQAIREGFEKLVERTRDRDKVVIYFGGHGDEGQGQTGYWIPHDARSGKASTYISNSDLLGYMKRIPARHLLLISDACFSGSLFGNTGRRYESPDFRDLERRKSRWVISSGNLTPVDDIASGSRHSAFAVHLLEFLRHNDEPYVTARQIHGRIAYRVAQSSSNQQYPRAAPIKEIGDEGGELVFWLRDGVDERGERFPPPWEAGETAFLSRLLQDLNGYRIWVNGGGDRSRDLCEKLEALGMIVECDPERPDRNRNQIVFFCSTIPMEAGPAILDYLGLRGYRVITHENKTELYDDRACGSFNEIILYN